MMITHFETEAGKMDQSLLPILVAHFLAAVVVCLFLPILAGGFPVRATFQDGVDPALKSEVRSIVHACQ
jgi:hypothetical protein